MSDMNALARRQAAAAERRAARKAERDAERAAQGKEARPSKPTPPKYTRLMAELAWMKERHAAILSVLSPEDLKFLANPTYHEVEEERRAEVKAPEWAGASWHETVKGERIIPLAVVLREDAQVTDVIGNLGKTKNVSWVETTKHKRIAWPLRFDEVTFYVGGEAETMKRGVAIQVAFDLGPEIEALEEKIKAIIAFWPTYPKGRPEPGCPEPLWREYKAMLARAEDAEDAEKRKAEAERVGKPQAFVLARETVDTAYQAMRGARGRPEQKTGESDADFKVRVEAWVEEARERVKFPELTGPDNKPLPGVMAEVRLSGEERRMRMLPAMRDQEPADKPNRIKVRGNPAVTFTPDTMMRTAGIADAIIARRISHGKK